MADRKHPKTHVEDQDLDGLRKQPLSPLHEGIDPLTESDTMLPREDTKTESEKIAKKADAEVAQENTETPDAPKSGTDGSKTSSR